MNLLFFGAGASIPFYPSLTTDYITKEIKKLCNWEYIIELYNETNNSKIDCTKIITLLKTIITTNPQANFEEICGFIDSITNILIDAERNIHIKPDKSVTAKNIKGKYDGCEDNGKNDEPSEYL